MSEKDAEAIKAKEFDPFLESRELLGKELAAIHTAEVDLTPIIESRLYLEKCIQEVEYLLQSSSISQNPGNQTNYQNNAVDEGSYNQQHSNASNSQLGQLPNLHQKSRIDLGLPVEVPAKEQPNRWTLVGPFTGHLDAVRRVIFTSPERIVTASDDGTIKKWDLGLYNNNEAGANTSIVSQTHRGHQGAVLALRYDPVTGNLYSAGQDGCIMIWGDDVPPLNVQLLGHDNAVWDLDIHVQSRRLASASSDGTVKVWDIGRDVDSKSLIARIGYLGDGVDVKTRGETPAANAVAFIEDGGKLVIGYENEALHVVDIKTGRRLLQLQNIQTSEEQTNLSVIEIIYLEEKNAVLTSHDNGYIRLFDLGSGELRKEWQAHFNGPACMALSPNGQELITGGLDRVVKFWNIADDIEHTQEVQMNDLTSGIFSVAWYNPSACGGPSEGVKYRTASVGGDTYLHVYEK